MIQFFVRLQVQQTLSCCSKEHRYK